MDESDRPPETERVAERPAEPEAPATQPAWAPPGPPPGQQSAVSGWQSPDQVSAGGSTARSCLTVGCLVLLVLAGIALLSILSLVFLGSQIRDILSAVGSSV